MKTFSPELRALAQELAVAREVWKGADMVQSSPDAMITADLAFMALTDVRCKYEEALKAHMAEQRK